jgi:NTP pyrophosphatase (non-canonical NTP hydrolase)
MDRIDSLDALRAELRAFVAARDWAQYHNPKNLAMALVGEAAEIVEHFQWLTPEEADRLAPTQHAEVELELADVLIYLVELADRMNVDLLAAAQKKLAINEQRYPVERARGSAAKYDKL